MHEFAEAFSKVRKGGPIERRNELSFNSMETLRSILTEKRIELLKIIKQKQPNSIYELAHFVNRDLKSVNTDIKILSSLGLLSLEEVHDERKKIKPIVEFDTLQVEIAI